MNIFVFSGICPTLVTRVIWLFALVDSKESFVVSSLYSSARSCSYDSLALGVAWMARTGHAPKQGVISASPT